MTKEILTQETLTQFHDSLELQDCPHDYTIINMAFTKDSDQTLFDPIIIGTAWFLVLGNLKVTAHEFFWGLAKIVNPNTNIGVAKPENKTEANKFSRAYVELNKKDLVKRTYPGHYMINPTVIIPPKTYTKVMEHWHSL